MISRQDEKPKNYDKADYIDEEITYLECQSIFPLYSNHYEMLKHLAENILPKNINCLKFYVKCNFIPASELFGM